MGFMDFLARATGADKHAVDMEQDMASDPTTPPDVLRRMAEVEPRLHRLIRDNPNCPEDLAAWLDRQLSQGAS